MKIKSIQSIVTVCLFALLLLLLTFQFVSAGMESSPSGQPAFALRASAAESGVAIPLQQAVTTATLQAASGLEIDFYPGNSDRNPLKKLPHLVLYRDGVLNPPISRTLIVNVSNVAIPPGGIVTVTVMAETQHLDPDAGGWAPGSAASAIPVWNESRAISNTEMFWANATVIFTREFTATVVSGVIFRAILGHGFSPIGGQVFSPIGGHLFSPKGGHPFSPKGGHRWRWRNSST